MDRTPFGTPSTLSPAETLVPRQAQVASGSKNLCEEAINEFLDSIGPDDRMKNPFVRDVIARRKRQESGDCSGSSADDVQLEQMRQCIKRIEAKKKEGKTYRLLEKISPFLEALGRLTKACESALQATPFGVAIAFSGARVVLEAAAGVQDALGEVIEALEDITPSLHCYQYILAAQAGSPNMADAIKRAYVHILEFWRLAAKTLDRGHFAATASPILKNLRSVVQTSRDRIRLDSQRVQDLLAASHAMERSNARRMETRNAITQWIRGDTKDSALLSQEQDLSTRQECRTPGTCQWMLERDEFAAWRDSKDRAAAVLWYHAPPGTGKSVLASAVVHHLRERVPNALVACFFYTFSEGDKCRGLTGLRSLALQLLRALSSYIPDALESEYTSAQKDLMFDLSGASDAVHDKVWRILQVLFDHIPQVYVVLDGLDECLKEGRAFLSTLEKLIKADINGMVKWFFSSCDVGSIRQTMFCVGAVEVQADFKAISRDVRAYLATQDICMVHADDWIDPGEKNFLYARLRCEIVNGVGYTTIEDIMAALRAFPAGLDSCYIKALERIARKSSSERSLARRVFRLLITFEKPVTVNELLDALAIRRNARNHSPLDYGPIGGLAMVQDICSPLIAVEEGKAGRVVKLCHKSVRDFLVGTKTFESGDNESQGVDEHLRSFLVNPKEAEIEIGLDCLAYLQNQRYTDLLDPGAILNGTPTTQKEHAFLRYAACFWHSHLWMEEPADPVVIAVKEFLQSPAFWTCIYVQAQVARHLFARYNRARGTVSSFTPTMGRMTDASMLFALPLPQWMAGRGSGDCASLDRSFCAFVQDWGELLTKSPGHLAMAVPLTLFRPGCNFTPQGKQTLIRARYASKLLGQVSGLYVVGSSLCVNGKGGEKTLQLWMIREEENALDRRVRVYKVSVFPKAKVLSDGDREHVMSTAEDPGRERWINALIKSELGEDLVQSWRVDPETLSVRRVWRGSQGHSLESFVPEALQAVLLGQGRVEGLWRLVQLTVATEARSAGTRAPTRVFHLRWVPRADHECRCKDPRPGAGGTGRAGGRQEAQSPEAVKSMASIDPGSDSDSSSDSGSDDDPSLEKQDDTEEPAPEEPDHTGTLPHRDCLIVASDFGNPVWRAITTDHSRWSNIVGARHPVLPVVVVSHRPGQLDVFDDEAGTSCVVSFTEEVKGGSGPSAQSREVQFSPCGSFVHVLSVSFVPTSLHTECRVTLSTYRFTHEGPSLYSLDVIDNPIADFTYRFAELLRTLPAPFVMTYWTPEAAILALPPLTYSPKIVRIVLGEGHKDAVTTSAGPIFFPASTVWRRPHLLYSESTAGAGGRLYLVLDASRTGCGTVAAESQCGRTGCKNFKGAPEETHEQPGEQEKEFMASPPVVLRWKMAGKGEKVSKDRAKTEEDQEEGIKWRPWDTDEDGRSEDVKAGRSRVDEYRMLRGDFVGGKRYLVPFRSGLDWTRPGVLSCM